MTGSLYSHVLLITALLFVGLALYGWRQRRMRGATVFSLAMFLLAVWPFAQAVDVVTSDLAFKILLMKIRLMPPQFAGGVWLVMIAQLTNQTKLIKRWHWLVICLPQIFQFVLLLSDSPLLRHSYFVDLSEGFPVLRWTITPLYYFFTLHVTILYLTPLLLLRKSAHNLSLLSTQQTFVLSISTFLPVLVNLLFQFHLTLVPGFNLAPLVQVIMGLLIGWTIFRYHAFQVVPLAHTILFDQMSDGMIVVDKDNLIIDINSAAKQFIGRSANLALGQPVTNVFASWQSLIEQFRDNPEIESEIAIEGNPSRQFDIKITPLRNRSGQVTGHLSIFREVTERKQAEAMIKTSEEKFRQLYNNNPLMLFTLATDGTVIAVNPTAIMQMGYAESELIGHSVLSIFHPEDHPKVIESLQQYLQHPVQTTPWEFRKVTNDGKSIWVSESLQLFHDRHGESFVLVVCEDITPRKLVEEALRKAHAELELRVQERTAELTLANRALEHEIEERRRIEVHLRASETRLRTVVESSPNGIVTGDERGLITMVNTQIEKLFGYPRHELIGQPLEILLPPRFHTSDPLHLTLFSADLHDYPLHQDTEILGLRKDGNEFPAEIALNLLDTSPSLSVLGTIMDISARKQAAEEQHKLQLQLQHSQKLESLGVLAGGIAHDFNNLLTNILGYADLAAHQLLPDSTAHRFTQQAIKGAQQAAQLTNQMLAYSGKGRFVVEAINLSSVVEEMTRLLQVSISKKCMIKYDFSPNLPAIEADAAQIRQIIMNLVINASDAIGQQSGIIAVSTSVIHCDRAYLAETYLDENLPEGTYAALEVADTGSGMTAETCSKIFDPFFTTKFTGRGLGLAAVLGIVRGRRGAIKIYSELGQGTTIKVLFPVTNLALKTTQNQENQASQWQGAGIILVVDDEKALRQVSADMLESRGFTVLTAADGREAVEIFRRQADQIRLVLLDLTMPNLDGEETFRELRRIRSDVRAILTSGYNEQTVTSRFAGKGLAGFIQKPYMFKELLAIVRKVLENGKEEEIRD